jgi:signal transduction histidine kinase
MQAQPQSNLAARTTSTLPSTPSPSPPPASADATPPASPDATPPAAVRTPSLADSTGLAHDAGNLLAALALYSDLLHVAGVLRPEHQHYATELRLISNRSSQLIQRLLSAPAATAPDPAQSGSEAPLSLPPKLLGRRNARASDVVPATPNHAAMLRSLAPVLERIAAGAAHITVTSPASLPPLDFPSEIIERITVNLVRNAAEAIRRQQASAPPSTLPPSGKIPASGKIQVTLAEVAGHAQLTVEDNGPGMPPAIAAAYLQPLPLPLGAIHGLGHRIVHELVNVSAGKLSIQVRPGKGTVFCLQWPLTPQPPAHPTSLLPRRDP